MRKPPRQRKNRPMAIGMAWFDREQWQRLTEAVENRSELDDTYEQWEKSALEALRTLERQGHRVERVHIDVGALVAWCEAKGLPVNGASRAEYVTFLLRQRDVVVKV